MFSYPLFLFSAADILHEHQSRKQTPHRAGRSAHESPLPELSEKMTLQAGQISNLQQNFGSIQSAEFNDIRVLTMNGTLPLPDVNNFGNDRQ